MIATVNSQLLAAELRLLCKVVPTKPAIAILGHVLITAREGELHLYATDLEVSLSSSCPADVELPGRVALPAAKLLQMVEQFPDADVNVSEDKQVLIRCGAFRSKVSAMRADDFPVQPAVEGITCALDGRLSQLIAKTRHAISMTASKRILQGALLTLAGPTGAMVATDGKRLALATMSREGPDLRIIIPAKALDMLPDGEIEVTEGPRHLFFKANGRMLTSRTIDGEYPKYDRIIPRGNDKVVTVERLAFAAALRRVGTTSEGNRAVRIRVTPGLLELSSSSSEVGSADEPVIVGYEGPSLKVSMNGDYILDFLNAASSETIILKLKDESTAAYFSDGEDHLEVIMLMRG